MKLTLMEQKKYALAIERGYFKGFDENPTAWKHTFAGAYVWQNPNRVKVLDIFTGLLGHVPTWEDITDLNLEDFAEAVRNAYVANTARNRFAEIKSVINRHANEVDIPSKRYADILRQKAEPSQAVYLTEEEIERINKYTPVTENERYVKRTFLIEAYTGARNGDAERLTRDNCDSITHQLTYTSQKTKTLINLPVHRNLMKYLTDRTYDIMPMSTFNRTLRSICKKVGINETVAVFRRGENTCGEKWEYVSSHTGRRSFATNLYLRGADATLIARYMGHSSPEITMRRYIIGYIEASPEVLSFFN